MSFKENIASIDWWIATLIATAKRMAAMGAAWIPIGMAVGWNSAVVADADTAGYVANMVAGVIVMGSLGTCLALLGGKPTACWVGALGGALIAFFLQPWSPFAPNMQLNLGIVMGGLFAATCWPWLQMTAYIASQLRNLAQV